MSALLLALAVLVLSSLCGLAVAARLPWHATARAVHLDKAVGLAIAPLLTGLAVVAVLWLLPGRPHAVHLAAVLLLVGAGAPWGWSVLRRRTAGPAGLRPVELLASVVLVGFFAAIVFDIAYVPLIQNDALEYATVARILHEARDLAAYPAISPQATASGFYGPWTHPPLYVAMMYLADVVQGSAASARALRVVSPWFLLTGAYCVFALGSLRSRAVGLVGAMIFISTPILFLGATSALIDPLPVLGMAIAFAALVGIDASPARRGAALGLMLGLALWTHSQAILFPCLLLPLLVLLPGAPGDGLRARLRPALVSALVAVCVCLLVGGAPYLRNVLLFGSPISDNPEVFAYAPLGFAEYFRMQRGISDPVEIIQYGVFKGFFALEAYSLAFWIGLLGMPLAARALSRQIGSRAEQLGAGHMLACALGVFIMYTAATAVSSSLGIDLMIKNERYMLVLIPCIAMLGACGLVGHAPVAGPRGWLRTGLVVLVLTFMPAQLVALVSYRQSQLRGEMVAWDEAGQLARWPHFEVMRYLRDQTPSAALVLTMKPADMFYAERKMVSYLDPRLLPFYGEKDNQRAWEALRRIGITHVHLTDYMLPPLYRSQLMPLLVDARYAELVSDAEGYQIYRLRDAPATLDRPDVSLSTAGSWVRETQVVLGGRKSRARIVLESQPFVLGQTSENRGFMGLFHRESGRVLISPALDLSAARTACPDGAELIVRLGFAGNAQVQLLSVQRDAAGAMLDRRILGDRPTLPNAPTALERRLPLAPGARNLVLYIEHRGASRLSLDQVTLAADCPAAATGRAP